MKNLKIKIALSCAILCLVAGTSCLSPKQRAEKKIQRLAKKHDLIVSDTLLIKDSVYVPEVTHNTTERIITHDTVRIIDNSRMTVKYYIKDSTIYVQGTCHDTTIVKEVEVIVEKIVIKELNYWQKNSWWIIPLLIILLILGIGAVFKEYLKRFFS
ncbi:MAG: hypothetical protein R3321_11610 [Nitrososphaeraceae archaeon]|nr:hypothetical protein [Nitrososphaeraceae archaeon]